MRKMKSTSVIIHQCTHGWRHEARLGHYKQVPSRKKIRDIDYPRFMTSDTQHLSAGSRELDSAEPGRFYSEEY
jgi:hypothetical protein